MGNGLDTPMAARGNYKLDIQCLVQWFHELIPDKNEVTIMQPFMETNVDSGADFRYKKPWILLDMIASGQSAPIGYPGGRRSWQEYLTDYIRDCMHSHEV